MALPNWAWLSSHALQSCHRCLEFHQQFWFQYPPNQLHPGHLRTAEDGVSQQSLSTSDGILPHTGRHSNHAPPLCRKMSEVWCSGDNLVPCHLSVHISMDGTLHYLSGSSCASLGERQGHVWLPGDDHDFGNSWVLWSAGYYLSGGDCGSNSVRLQ